MKYFQPRPVQVPIIEKILSTPRCGIWSGMGTGKTSATLSALVAGHLVNGNVFPALIIAPLRVATNVWPYEVQGFNGSFGHLRVSVICGTPEQRLAAIKKDADIYVINYDNVKWLTEKIGDAWPYKTVVADESPRLKGVRVSWQVSKNGVRWLRTDGAQRAGALARIADKTDNWINLTGSPATNGLKDLWGQTWFLDFGKRLGNSYSAFTDRWFITRVGTSREQAVFEPRAGAEKEIMERIADLHVCLDPYDWFDVARPVEVDIPVMLPKKLQDQYKELHKHSILELTSETSINAVNAGAKMLKCLQFAAGSVMDENKTNHHIHDHKLDALESIVTELNGAPLLVAYRWREDLPRLKKRFPQGRELDKKKSTEDDWNAGKIPLLFIHPQSAGHGLSLQYGGNNIAILNLDYNLEYYEQVIERIGPVRQMQAGFKRPVNVYRIVVKDTWEELVAKALTDKTTVQEMVKNAVKSWRDTN